jgi:type I restriction enzyme M protein
LFFPQDLFYPTGVHTLGIFIKKGVPHDKKQNVLWIRSLHDGFVKKKGKRLRNEKEPDDLANINALLNTFIKTSGKMNVKSMPKFVKASPIDTEDEDVELVPEVYLDDEDLTIDKIHDEVENLIRESVAYLIKTRKEGRLE